MVGGKAVSIATKLAEEYNEAQRLKKIEKSRLPPKIKDKKKKGFLHALKGAAKFAIKVAPSVLPMFLANHGPTVQAAARTGLGAVGTSAPSIAGVPVATASSFGSETGLKSLVERKQGGKVVGVTMSGCDFMGTISGDGSILAGDLLKTIDLNPMSPDWSGTRLQRELALWTKFKPVHYAFVAEPIAPTLTPGQFVVRCVSDPDQPPPAPGRAGIQEMVASAGAEMFPVWQLGCADYYAAGNNTFFAKPYGSDKRLVSPGVYQLAASSDIPYEGGLTSIYACWEMEAEIPLLDTGLNAPLWLGVTAQPAVTPNPLIDWFVNLFGDWQGAYPAGGLREFDGPSLQYDDRVPPHNFPFNWFTPGDGSALSQGWITGLPAGTYRLSALVSANTSPAPVGTPALTWSLTGSPLGISNIVQTNVSAQGQNTGTTVWLCEYLFTVLQPGNPVDPSVGAVCLRGTLGLSGTGYSAPYVQLYLSSIPAFMSEPDLTLQDYERVVSSLVNEVREIRAALAAKEDKKEGPPHALPYSPAAGPAGTVTRRAM